MPASSMPAVENRDEWGIPFIIISRRSKSKGGQASHAKIVKGGHQPEVGWSGVTYTETKQTVALD